MPKTTCHDAFEEAQKCRAGYPLTSGAYKLRDTHRALSRMRVTIDAIADYRNRPGSYAVGQTLGQCCTTEDKAIWLKNLPKQVADMLGHDILPAIAALTGDGITKREVARELASATSDVNSLLRDCEEVRVSLSAGGIGHEYKAMKQGQSHLRELLTRTLSIAKLNHAQLGTTAQMRRIRPPLPSQGVTGFPMPSRPL
jgi:hypothetical protein